MATITRTCRFPLSKWKSECGEEVNVMYVWTVRKFKEVFKFSLHSPYFTAHGYEDTFWKLEMRLEGDWIGVHLKLCCSSMHEFDVKSRFSIINRQGEEVNSKETLIPEHIYISTSTDFQQLIKRKTLFEETNDLLPNESFTIYCKFMFVICRDHVNDEFRQIKTPAAELSNLLKSLLASGNYSDVNFIVGDHKFTGHKAILASRSKFFADMFEAEGNKLQTVTVTNISPEVFKEMLYFIYTGKIPKLGEMAQDLLDAAQKYDLEELECICSKIPSDKLTAEQAADLLFLADDYNAVSLKEKALIEIKAESNYAIITKGGKITLVVCTHPYSGACSYH